mmetsp:Transcript_114194/g.362983  ORF Transcript_114194/g.362983 Transcript_114194/m.362983 type:complete len:118 (+) Transcript_114194:127-480(+)
MHQPARHRPRRARKAQPDEHHSPSKHVAQEPFPILQGKDVRTRAVDDVPGFAINPMLRNGARKTGTPREELNNFPAFKGGKTTAEWRNVAARNIISRDRAAAAARSCTWRVSFPSSC